MAQETLVFLSGILLFVTPFLGIPADWKTYIYVGIAVLLLLIGYRLRYARFVRTLEAHTDEHESSVFSEDGPQGRMSAHTTSASG